MKFPRVLRRLRREDGAALIVALGVAFVVMLLSVTVVSQAIHNVEQSARNRRNLHAIGGAEAGIVHYYNFLEGATPASIAASGCSVTEQIGAAPGNATFTATLTLYDAAGAPIPCAQAASSTLASALIRSTGSSANDARTMESYVELRPSYGAFEAAIVSEVGLGLANNLTLNGQVGNDADVWVNTGNLSITNNASIAGSVYGAGGTGSISNNTTISGDVWVNGGLTVSNNAFVQGDVSSSASSVAVTNNARVDGDARAGTTISGTNIGGTLTPNAPSDPPPQRPFPQITSSVTAWQAAGYTVQTFADCTSARNALANTTQNGNVLVRITAVCQLSFTGNTKVWFNGNLGVLTDGSIRSANNVRWEGVGGTRKLFLMSTYRTGLPCATGSYNVVDVNNVAYPSAEVLFYSPCAVSIANNSGFAGQVVAGTVSIQNNFTMNYRPAVVPGAVPTGFEQDIAYIREVS